MKQPTENSTVHEMMPVTNDSQHSNNTDLTKLNSTQGMQTLAMSENIPTYGRKLIYLYQTALTS